MVLVLLTSAPMAALVALFLTLLIAAPAAAVERTFIFSPADFVSMVDTFNGEVLTRSASFRGQVRIRPEGVRFFGRSCPSLRSGANGISRIRILESAARAAALAGRRPNLRLGFALQSMGIASWAPPAA